MMRRPLEVAVAHASLAGWRWLLATGAVVTAAFGVVHLAQSGIVELHRRQLLSTGERATAEVTDPGGFSDFSDGILEVHGGRCERSTCAHGRRRPAERLRDGCSRAVHDRLDAWCRVRPSETGGFDDAIAPESQCSAPLAVPETGVALLTCAGCFVWLRRCRIAGADARHLGQPDVAH